MDLYKLPKDILVKLITTIQETEKNELEKLRYLASQVTHCSNCYIISPYITQCSNCYKFACMNCCGNWVFKGYGYYCEKCNKN